MISPIPKILEAVRSPPHSSSNSSTASKEYYLHMYRSKTAKKWNRNIRNAVAAVTYDDDNFMTIIIIIIIIITTFAGRFLDHDE